MDNLDVQFLELFRKLTPDQRQAFLEFARLLYEGVKEEAVSEQGEASAQEK